MDREERRGRRVVPQEYVARLTCCPSLARPESRGTDVRVVFGTTEHLDVEAELMKLQVKLYNDYYAARKAEVSKIPHFWFGALIKDSQCALSSLIGPSNRPQD